MNEFNQVANIKVFGIGGGGSNAVNRMVADGVKGVTFYIANTDVQVMKNSDCENKIVLGRETTKGLGAGGNPEVGRKAAEETENEIREAIKGSDMVFLTAGLGGGTGTGAAPLFAKVAKEEGALTIGIVTKPFTFEGRKRERNAMSGLSELQKYTDSLIIVSNNNLLDVIGRRPIEEAFQAADNVLRQGVQTISDLIAVPALVNLDFADVRSVMQNQGAALITHNYHTRMGEIDLILREPDGTLVFCEVKTRAKDSLDTPAAAVNAAKQRRIIASAAWYLQSTHQSDEPVRFDVAEVVPLDSGRWMVHIIKGAFCAK